MDLTEIKDLLDKLSQKEIEKLYRNLKRITFDFKVNKSFLNYSSHPLTIPKEFYPFLDIHKISRQDEATIILPDDSTASGYIHYSRAGWGEYHQIRIRNPYSGTGISKLKVGDMVKVEIYKEDTLARINLSTGETGSSLARLLKNSSKNQFTSKHRHDKLLQLQNEEEQLLGEKQRHEPMFYYVRMEDMVPENHLLRLIDKYIDLGFIREKVKHLYSHTGRPSIDPEVLLRMLLIGYLYGITSERRLCEDVNMHIGYRWFVGLSLEDKVPDHSTFSKNRHERFAENNIFQDIFDEIVSQCVAHGLLRGKHLTVDSTYIKANASFKSLEPIVVDMNGKEYIEKLKEENPVGNNPWEPGDDYPHRGHKISNKTHRSKTDPDARLGRKSYKSSTELYYSATYVMDNKSRIVVGTDVGEPDKKTDCNRAIEQIRKAKWRHRIEPESLGADKGYSAGTFLNNLLNENIQPHIPIVKYEAHNHKDIYHRDGFQYDKDKNVCICPAGKELRYWGLHKHNTQQVYRASVKDCKPCSQKPLCTKDRARSVSCHLYENAIQKAQQLNETKEYRISQRKRKLIEELFGEAKEYMGLRVSKFRRMKFVREQVLMTAAAQNIKRMVKLLSGRGPRKVPFAIQKSMGLFPIKELMKIFNRLPQNINEIPFEYEYCLART